MKASVLYFSQTGNTRTMAEAIVQGMQEAKAEARAFSIEALDEEWLRNSDCVIIGTPTYYADVSGKMKLFLESLSAYKVAGKLGGAFATAQYIHGGGDIAIQTILRHMLVCGMAVYSGGGAQGKPVIHLGPVAVGQDIDADRQLFRLYGQRMADKAKMLFA